MKPWFEKEAEIIPFPKKPERQVIKMPSVSEYPDFITGVQDLQARLKKGQIGKDSYDRLYQDLIHRFMKKESFETPWFLREDVTSQTDQTIDKIADIGKKTNDPKINDHIKKVFQKVIDYANKALGKTQESMNEQPAVAITSTDQGAMLVKNKLDDMAKKFGNLNPNLKQYVEKQFNDIFAFAQKTGVEKGAADERQALNDFLIKFDSTIDALTNKITSSEQAFIDANSGDPTKKVQKSISTKKNTISVIKQVIRSIFSGKVFKQGTIGDRELQKKLLSFLNAAKEGIVDWGKILQAGKGKKASVESFVPSEYKEIFEMFKTQLFRARPPTTAGAWGPGEVGLILLGNPITKASDSGDLQDAKTGAKFELKGSNKATKGGRLSPEGLSTTKMPGVFNNLKDRYIGTKALRKAGTKSSLNKPSFNTSFIDAFNDLIDSGLKVKTKEFVTDVIKGAFTDQIPTDKELEPYVAKMIKGNKIDPQSFLRNYSKFLFDRYQGTGKDTSFQNVIVFNPGTTTYTVLDSSKDLDSPDLKITGGIEFNATQVPKSPQIGIA